MREPVERQHVVLAKRVEGNRALDHLAHQAVRITAALGRECGQQVGVTLVPGGRVVQGPESTLRRPLCAWCSAVQSERSEDLREGALEALPILGRDPSGRDVLRRHGVLRVRRQGCRGQRGHVALPQGRKLISI